MPTTITRLHARGMLHALEGCWTARYMLEGLHDRGMILLNYDVDVCPPANMSCGSACPSLFFVAQSTDETAGDGQPKMTKG